MTQLFRIAGFRPKCFGRPFAPVWAAMLVGLGVCRSGSAALFQDFVSSGTASSSLSSEVYYTSPTPTTVPAQSVTLSGANVAASVSTHYGIPSSATNTLTLSGNTLSASTVCAYGGSQTNYPNVNANQSGTLSFSFDVPATGDYLFTVGGSRVPGGSYDHTFDRNVTTIVGTMNGTTLVNGFDLYNDGFDGTGFPSAAFSSPSFTLTLVQGATYTVTLTAQAASGTQQVPDSSPVTYTTQYGSDYSSDTLAITAVPEPTVAALAAAALFAVRRRRR